MTDMNGEMMPGMPDPFVQQLSSYLTISTGVPLFNQQPSLKRCVPIAMDRAIREVITIPPIHLTNISRSYHLL